MTIEDLATYEEYKATGNRGKPMGKESIETMNEFILDRINAEVEDPEKDTVLINGDFVFGNSPKQYYAHAQYARNRINCKDVRIVFGNHDNPDAIHDLFSHCYQQALIYIGKQKVFFNHFPMVTWEGSHRGTILCYGHVHALYTKPSHPHPMAHPELWAAVDIGVDTNNYHPYTLPQLFERVKPIWEAQQAARENGKEHHMF
jgi:calcineurin-like phosphoesterase family protein